MRRTVVNDRVPVEAAHSWLWQQSRRNEQRGEHVVDLSCSRVAHVDHPAEYGEQQVPLPSDEKRTTRCPLLLFGVSVVTAVAVTVTTIVCIHTTFR